MGSMTVEIFKKIDKAWANRDYMYISMTSPGCILLMEILQIVHKNLLI